MVNKKSKYSKSQTLEISDDFYKVILENIPVGVYFTNKERKIIYWNNFAEKITGFKEEVIGKTCRDNILNHVDDKGTNLCLTDCPLSLAMKNKITVEARVYLHHKEGYRIPIYVRVNPLLNRNGDIIGAIEIFYHDSYVKSLEEKINNLERLAMVDELTNLVNRRYIKFDINSKIQQTKRHNRLYGIIYIDLDNFKKINDRFGHHIGDKVLKMIANTLQNNLRASDTVGRLGGDEFIAIVEIDSRETLEKIANKLSILIENSFLIVNNTKITIKASIGAYIIKPYDTVSSALKKADQLMYVSKNHKKKKVTIENNFNTSQSLDKNSDTL